MNKYNNQDLLLAIAKNTKTMVEVARTQLLLLVIIAIVFFFK